MQRFFGDPGSRYIHCDLIFPAACIWLLSSFLPSLPSLVQPISCHWLTSRLYLFNSVVACFPDLESLCTNLWNSPSAIFVQRVSNFSPHFFLFNNETTSPFLTPFFFSRNLGWQCSNSQISAWSITFARVFILTWWRVCLMAGFKLEWNLCIFSTLPMCLKRWTFRIVFQKRSIFSKNTYKKTTWATHQKVTFLCLKENLILEADNWKQKAE